ncbi:hypothetical protein D3C71_1965360 [compost metagenome]
MFAQHILLRIDQHFIQTFQPREQGQISGVGDRKSAKRQVIAEAKLMLQIREPRGIDVQHQVRPGLVVDRIAGMHIGGIHQHYGADADLEL